MGEQVSAAEGFAQIANGKDIVSADDIRLQADAHLVLDLCRLVQNLDLREHLFAAFSTLDGLFAVEGF